MITGWKPKNIGPQRIPLYFESRFDEYLEELISQKNKNLIFLGFRPSDSIMMHYTFSNKNTYNFNFGRETI